MSQPVNDLRVTRSQRFIREALIDLIEERSFDALSVGEITARAMVSRATFYRHYRDKYDLVEQIYAQAMQALLGAIAVQETVHSPQIWVTFFDHVAEYDRLYGALLGEKGSPWFVRKMRTSLINLIKEFGRAAPQWQSDSAHPISLYPAEDDLIPDVIATMFVEAITWWLEHGKPFPPQEMARRGVALVGAIFKETSTW